MILPLLVSPPCDPPFSPGERGAISDTHLPQGQFSQLHEDGLWCSYYHLMYCHPEFFFYIDLNVNLYIIRINHRRMWEPLIKRIFLFCAFLEGWRKETLK